MPHDMGSSPVPPVAGSDADRRTVRRVAAVGAAAVAATALATAGVASGAGAGSGSAAPGGSDVPGRSAVATASASASPSASASASASAAAPQLRIQIAYDRVGRALTLSFTFAGYVLEPLSPTGGKLTFPTPAKRNIGMGETLLWGDGTNANVPVTGRRCPVDAEKRTLHEVKDTYAAKKTYSAPGTYTVNYSYAACGLTNGKISGTITINIPK